MYQLDESSPSVKQPRGLKVKLRPHQLTSIAAMRELEKQATIIIDKPQLTSGLYNIVKTRLNDIAEFTGSTFIIETNSAILADKVGSGKTYMIIGLILNTPLPNPHDRFLVGTDHYSIKMNSVKESSGVNLIVVPHGLANQWGTFMDNSSLDYLKLNSISDFDVFFDIDYVTKRTDDPDCPLVLHSNTRKKNIPGFKVKETKAKPNTKPDTKAKTGKNTKGGSKTTKVKAVDMIYERKRLNMKKVNDIIGSKKVFILNVNRYKFFKQIFRSIKWARVIIDEMDSAHIPSIFTEFGNFNWFLTATPTSIFYQSCRRYVNKIFGSNQQLLEYFVVKNKDEYVDASLVLPKPYVYMINTLLQKVVSAIQDLIPPDVLKLINAGNMKEAVAKLNCDCDTEENIVKVLTDKINTELYNLKKELEYVESLIPVDQDAHDKKIIKLNADIQRCNTKLETINERINSIKDECCFICAESFTMPAITDCCKSVFCLKCLLSALKAGGNKCPYCRHTIKNNKEYHVIAEKPSTKNKIIEKKKSIKGFDQLDKTDVLEKILSYISKNVDAPKILIFSDYSQTFEKIIKNITKANLQYALLSGVPAHITRVIDEFRAGITNILMLDSEHYGSGLNLQEADYLILYHRMRPELETQVIGRAQRFGIKKPLKIIYLVNDSENKITKLSNNPLEISGQDELWMLTDPPQMDQTTLEENIDDDNIEDIHEEILQEAVEEAVEEAINKSVTKKKKTKKNIIKENNDKDTEESDEVVVVKPKNKPINKKNKYAKSTKNTKKIESDDDLIEKITKKKSKKKYVDV